MFKVLCAMLKKVIAFVGFIEFIGFNRLLSYASYASYSLTDEVITYILLVINCYLLLQILTMNTQRITTE